MAATSPYTQNDYQAVSNFRPYELPINDIFKAISAQNQFWDQGAARVKAVYDSALGLNLTLTADKELRKQFMKDAEKELVKLSSMNVGEVSVQRQGFNIFKPLFNDKGIMWDDFITNKRESILAEAQRYKTDEKTKGEGYNTENLIDALSSFEGFDDKTSRDQLEEIYGKTKNSEYIPFHNYTKEMMDIAVKCPNDALEGNTLESLYFKNIKDAGQIQSKLAACLKISLSPKSWQQLQITGRVRMGKDYATIAKSYGPLLKGNNVAYAKEILEHHAVIKANKDNKEFTPELKKQYTDEIDLLQRQIEDNDKSVLTLQAGDFSEIEKNYDNVIAQVYGQQKIDDFSRAYSYKKYSELYSTNAAAVATQALNWSNVWKSRQYELDERNSDINLLKALGGMGAGGAGGADGGGAGAGSATYQMMSQIRQRLGIPSTISAFLDEGRTIENVGKTIDQIENSVKVYQNELSNKRDKLDFAITKLAGKNAAIVQSVKKANDSGDLYEIAEGIIKTYYKDFKGTVPDEEILNIEEALDDYNKTSIKSTHFLKMRDRINEEIDKDPKVKEDLASKAQWVNYWTDAHKGMTGYDFVKKQWLTFDKDKLTRIYSGIDDEYSLDDDGDIVDSYGNAIGYTSSGKSFKEELRDDWTKLYVGSAKVKNGHKALKHQISNLNKNITTQIMPKIQDVVRNSISYNVGSEPGLPESIRQQFSFLPEVAANQVRFVPTIAYDLNGELVTEVTAQKYDPATKTWGDHTSKVKKDIKNSSYSQNSMLNNVMVKDGKLLVKTPYLPPSASSYELQDVVEDLMYQTRNISLKNGATEEIKVSNLVGGASIGFDIVGAGLDAQGNRNQVTYMPYIKNAAGEKVTVGLPSSTSSDLSNQLKQMEESYYERKPYKNKK